MQNFGEKVRILRKETGMTIVQLANISGYSTHSHISEIENGKRQPPLAFVIKVSRIFKISTDMLLNDDIELDIPKNEGKL